MSHTNFQFIIQFYSKISYKFSQKKTLTPKTPKNDFLQVWFVILLNALLKCLCFVPNWHKCVRLQHQRSMWPMLWKPTSSKCRKWPNAKHRLTTVSCRVWQSKAMWRSVYISDPRRDVTWARVMLRLSNVESEMSWNWFRFVRRRNGELARW